ncbi:hypothetical protein CP02DC21_1980, partial [Chlamydia psittaci 02DC21]
AFLVFLVLTPGAFLPHGVIGLLRPIGWRPSPPPCGWSLGFIAEPLTVGLIPLNLFLPAFPILTSEYSSFPTSPIVARHTA